MGNWARRACFVTAGTAIFVLPGAAALAQAQQRTCADFATQQEAQTFFEQNGGPQNDPFNLDVDNDGRACEGLPGGTGTTASPTPTASPGASATPTPTATPNGALPKNGAATTAMALSGLSFLEAGYGLTLVAKRLGVRRRALPLYLMRKLVRAAHEGQTEVPITDDVFLVRRIARPTPEAPVIIPTFRSDAPASSLSEIDILSEGGAPLGSSEPMWWEPESASMSWVDWPFFTPPTND